MSRTQKEELVEKIIKNNPKRKREAGTNFPVNCPLVIQCTCAHNNGREL